jgi:hypothetical protein
MNNFMWCLPFGIVVMYLAAFSGRWYPESMTVISSLSAVAGLLFVLAGMFAAMCWCVSKVFDLALGRKRK